MKTCGKCGLTKDESDFHVNKRRPDGRSDHCRQCRKEYMREYNRINSRRIQENNRQYRLDNPEKRRESRAKNRHRVREATPGWLSDADRRKIKGIYETCPAGHHVDHIVPLNGVGVCGLHVPWNLRQIPADDNLVKSNRVDDSIP